MSSIMYENIIQPKTLFLAFFLILQNMDSYNKKPVFFSVSNVDGNSSYLAGVVEYHPNNALEETKDIMNHNLENYLEFIHMAKNKSVDILVFPEATFNRHWEKTADFNAPMAFVVPDESEKIVACEDPKTYHKMLTDISCAAKDRQIYVVINVAERVNCNSTTNDNCPSKGFFLFNSNVVFDRKGAIISKYRKINLFGEPGFTPSIDQKLGVFETDFGVKFGHFICFDLLFQIPSVQVLQHGNIQNVIFPTMWFSELPFLVAAEIQQAYAYTHNINFLAAGANNPHVGSTGSGIYSGHEGALISIMKGEPTSELLVTEVPKIPSTLGKKNKHPLGDSSEVMDGLHLRHDRLIHYESYLFSDTQEDQNANLTSGRINCLFNLKLNLNSISSDEEKEGDEHYRYRAIAFDGIRSYTFKDSGVANCGLVACTDDSLASCATRFPKYSPRQQRIHIKSIQILATMPKPHFDEIVDSDNIVYHPVTLTANLLPLHVDSFEYAVTDKLPQHQLLNMSLTRPQSELLTFGITGLVFDRKE